MNRYCIIFLVILGMLFVPGKTYACGKSSEKTSCKKEISSTKSEKKSCSSIHSSTKKNGAGCEGSCGHSKCSCSSSCPTASVSFLAVMEFQNSNYNISQIEKKQFSYRSPSISDGFSSIWLIPKIS